MEINLSHIKKIIEDGWENRNSPDILNSTELREAINLVIDMLDKGSMRVVSNKDGEYEVNQFCKKAILLSFKFNDNRVIEGDAQNFYDKVPLKFAGLDEAGFKNLGARAVPGSVVRRGAFIGKSVVLMPSFVNIGAYVGEGTMVDTWATIGSCAQIGKNCHISGGAGIGGVLEPLQANPVIIEDNVFIGARSEIVEGVIVGTGSVISMGVFIGASTKIIDRETGEIMHGKIPPYSVVVPGSIAADVHPGKPLVSLYAAVIIKTVDSKTREKTSLNDLLREYDDND